VAVEADVASAASVAAAVERLHAALGPVHILVNDAGIAGLVPLREMTEDEWDRMIAVHLKGAFNCTRALLGDMAAAGWGRIVNVSSVAGLRGAPQLVHYSAAKAGLIGFTKALAAEDGPLGITVNAIARGLVDTPLLKRSGCPRCPSAGAGARRSTRGRSGGRSSTPPAVSSRGSSRPALTSATTASRRARASSPTSSTG